LIGIAKEFCLFLLCLLFFLFVAFDLSLLCLSFDFALGRLYFIILEDVASLDNFGNGVGIKRVFGLIDEFFDECLGPINFTVVL
jgi:hypothetical protein